MIDIHSHILPGIDDGAKNIAESVDIVRQLVRQGVTDVIATPHYIAETAFDSPRKENLKLLEELKVVLAEEGITVNLFLGNEIYICDRIAEYVKAGKMSTLANSEYLLVELPLDDEFPNYSDYLLELKNQGFKVILAHPERYSIVQDDFSVVQELYEAGILLQCNLGSIFGKYGKHAKRTIIELAKRKMIFAFGSDIHRCTRKEEVLLAEKKLRRFYKPRELNYILVHNPKKIIQGT